MKKFLAGAMIIAAAAMSTPASAGVTLNPNGSVTVGNGIAGSNDFTIYFDGYGGSSPHVVNGLTSNIVFTFTGSSGNSYGFSYVVNNTSSSPVTDSRVSGFAFDTDPNISGKSVGAGSVFDAIFTNGNYPVGYGNVEVCFSGAGSCAGGGGGGVDMGQATGNTGSFTLTFANAPSTILLSGFVDRYQSVAGSNATSNSAIGRQVAPVPEPGTWAMMLLGFGMIGFGLPRRQAPPLLQLA